MKKPVWGALAAVALACAGANAEATVYTLTFEGVVTGGDDFGTFGVNGNLYGYAYKSVYVVDVDRAGATTETGPGYSKVGGQDAANPISASITINGVTLDIPRAQTAGGYYIEANKEENGVDLIEVTSQNYDVVGYFDQQGGYHVSVNIQTLLENLYSELNDFTDGDIFSTPATYILKPEDGFYGDFSELVFDSHPTESITYRNTTASLQATKLTVSTGGAAVPEPGAWALMIAGFGLAGSTLRRRRVLEA